MYKFAVAVVAGFLLITGRGSAESVPSSAPSDQTAYRRAVDAVIWGMPIVSYNANRQAYFRDAKAKYNDIIWWPKGSGWKNQGLTVNTSVRYMFYFSNSKQDGPIVVQLPPAVPGASFYGTIVDAWFVPLVDIGVAGAGGKYLVLPPGYTGTIPGGYTVVRAKTYNTSALIRSIVRSLSPADVAAANALVARVKVYPLSKATNPPPQRLIDMSNIESNGLVHYDSTFFSSLAEMINEEPVQSRDLEMLGMLLPLGIEKGKTFAPNAEMTGQLNRAAADAHAWLIAKRTTFVTPWWPHSRWAIPSVLQNKGPDYWDNANYVDVDSRGLALSFFYYPTAKLGSGSFYFGTYADSQGQPLQGENTYRLRVPPKVPVSQFWAFTVYSQDTAALFRNSTHLTIDSLDRNVKKNSDGSIDIYIGPTAPPGEESNWVYTAPGQTWFPWFRVYGPQKGIFDKSWRLPDIEKVQ